MDPNETCNDGNIVDCDSSFSICLLEGTTVIIGGFDSGVPDTGSITGGILHCADGAGNHGQFVSCATHFLEGLGLSSCEKYAIQVYVGSSDIGNNK